MITDIEDFFARGCGRCPRFATPDCSTRRWSAGLGQLRRVCLAAGLAETVKWGHPCYVHGGRNIAIIGAFRDDFRLTFMNAALMKDPDRVLGKQGQSARHPDTIRFTGNGDVRPMRSVILAYFAEAIGYAEAGIKPAKSAKPLELPAELADALKSDRELRAAFDGLTPGRQRSYVIALASAKTSATRLNRIARFRPKIVAGKGATER